ncbi:phosphopantetheine-binding protein [Streptomyces dioscori]|uniref:Phosphopantetheine-binding protein n=1 Tax=Streptomyces dioscori TaxID=2109333 RepID=A0A2P8PT64_9ACTN|nr:acyl carrier protein [Streptomyces dioscori]PSM37178.1 phosphopantetheine-binding protein [Streptomyces dioscori]
MWDSRFEEILRQRLPFLSAGDSLARDSSLRDFGLDSMGAVELLASLENTFQVRFVDDALDMANFATPGTLWTTLSRMREAVA